MHTYIHKHAHAHTQPKTLTGGQMNLKIFVLFAIYCLLIFNFSVIFSMYVILTSHKVICSALVKQVSIPHELLYT
uniref:Uncharacterized protein n=1 Tax=Anguilla anguilla TaxID=7936 RepID=A0A0E9TS93_ANGAN